MAVEGQETSMPRRGSSQRLFEFINGKHALMADRVQNKDAWCDLGYVEGMPEFTVVQLSFFGDYIVTPEQLYEILTYATKVVTKS